MLFSVCKMYSICQLRKQYNSNNKKLNILKFIYQKTIKFV